MTVSNGGAWSRRTMLKAAAAAASAWPMRHGAADAHDADALRQRPQRVIVPFAPGGPSDAVLRVLGEGWQERHGQPLLIEHRPGAGGSLGAEAAHRAAPDGATVLFAPADVLVNNTLIRRDLPYDPVRDLAPLALIGSIPFVLVLAADRQVRSVAELRDWGRSRRVAYGSLGEGSHAHLLGAALLARELALDAVHVPYRGLGPMTQDLAGGQIDAGFAVPPLAAPHVAAGRLRAIAVSGERRSAVFTEVPTLGELGYGAAVFGLRQWAAFVVSRGVPMRVRSRLEHELVTLLDASALRQVLRFAGFEIDRVLGAADAAALWRADRALIEPMLRELGALPK